MAQTKSYTKEHRHTPQLTLVNTAIPHKDSTKILGVTYDTSLSFKDHIHDIKLKCTHRLNTLRTLTGTDFRQQKETLTLIYKQYICSVLEYASPAWAPNLAITHHNTLQTIQNSTLRIITGCTQTTPTNHLHCETQVLTLQDHINMRGTQFLAAASANPDHPCHYMLAHKPTPRGIKTTPQALYTGFLDTIHQHCSSHIHTHFTNLAILKLFSNTTLGTPPPEIHHLELALPRADRVNLSRLRCGHHTALATYRKRIDDSTDEVCTHCSTGTHSLRHIITHCPTH